MKLKSIIAAAAMTTMAMSAQAATTIKIGFNEALNSPMYNGVMKAAETLEKISGGEMKLATYPGAQLGNVHDMLEQVSMGELDMSMQVFGGYARYVPVLGSLETAYIVRDFDHLQKIFNSDFGMTARDTLVKEFNIRLIDNWYFGVRNTSSNKPINAMADMKGMRLRTPNAKALVNYAKATGAIPTPIAYAEVYLALQTNAVDGQENPLSSIDAMKFNEVQDYIAMTQHVVQDQAIAVSEITWKKLSQQEKDWLTTAFQIGGMTAGNIVRENDQNLVAKFESKGVTFTYPELKPYREAMKPYYVEIDKEYGKGTIKSLTSL